MLKLGPAASQNVINQFGATLKDERVSFLGNVTVGKDVSLDKLRSMFHGVRCCTWLLASHEAAALLLPASGSCLPIPGCLAALPSVLMLLQGHWHMLMPVMQLCSC